MANIDYLINEICIFKPLFDLNLTKKNIISSSFFKLTTSYKDFSLYTNGLIETYHYIQKNYLDFKFRLFIDDLIYNDKKLMEILYELKDLELVVYTYKQKYKNIGLLGTLIRFFPMFNFLNNDANIVLITDIDTSPKPSIYNIIKKLEDNKINLSEIYLIKFGNIAKNIPYKFKSIYKNTINIYSIAQSIINIKKINYDVIIKFIEKVLNSKKIYSYYINFNYNEDEYIKKIELNKPFIYGVDEYFINNTLSKYLIKNQLPLITLFKWNIIAPLYYICTRIENLEEKKKHILKKLLLKIFKKRQIKVNKKLDINKLYNILDDLVYVKKDINTIIILYNIFLLVNNKKKYKFIYPKDIYKIMINHNNLGIYELEKIIFTNLKYKDIIIKLRRFDKNTFLKIKKNLNK